MQLMPSPSSSVTTRVISSIDNRVVKGRCSPTRNLRRNWLGSERALGWSIVGLLVLVADGLVTTPSRPGEADVSYPLLVRRVPADSVPWRQRPLLTRQSLPSPGVPAAAVS